MPHSAWGPAARMFGRGSQLHCLPDNRPHANECTELMPDDSPAEDEGTAVASALKSSASSPARMRAVGQNLMDANQLSIVQQLQS